MPMSSPRRGATKGTAGCCVRCATCRASPCSLPASRCPSCGACTTDEAPPGDLRPRAAARSEEHTSELQSHLNLVCRLLLEKKKQNTPHTFFLRCQSTLVSKLPSTPPL